MPANKKKLSLGFTFIEIIIVIAVFVLIALIAVGGWQAAQVKKNDAKRAADAKDVQVALDSYYNANGVFPGVCDQGTPDTAASSSLGFDCLTPGKPLIDGKTNQTYLALAPLSPAHAGNACQNHEEYCYIPCPPGKYHAWNQDDQCSLDDGSGKTDALHNSTCDGGWNNGYQWIYCLDGPAAPPQHIGVNTTTYNGLHGANCDNAESDAVLCATKFGSTHWGDGTTTDSCGNVRHVYCGGGNGGGGGGNGCSDPACPTGDCCSGCDHKAGGTACGSGLDHNSTVAGQCFGTHYSTTTCDGSSAGCPAQKTNSIWAATSSVYYDANGDATSTINSVNNCSSAITCSGDSMVTKYFGCKGDGTCDTGNALNSTTTACAAGTVCQDGKGCVSVDCTGGACCDTSTPPNYKFMDLGAQPKFTAADGGAWVCMQCSGASSTPIARGSDYNQDQACQNDSSKPCRKITCSGLETTNGNSYCAYQPSTYACQSGAWSVTNNNCSRQQVNTYCLGSGDGSTGSYGCTGNTATTTENVGTDGYVWTSSTTQAAADCTNNCGFTGYSYCDTTYIARKPLGCTTAGACAVTSSAFCHGTDCNANTPPQVCSGGSCVTCTSTQTYYQDADGDGYGNPNVTTSTCSMPAGYTTDSYDCADNNNAIYPGAVGSCCSDGAYYKAPDWLFPKGTIYGSASTNTRPYFTSTSTLTCMVCNGNTNFLPSVEAGTIDLWNQCGSANGACQADTCSGNSNGNGDSYCAYLSATATCAYGAWSVTVDKCTKQRVNTNCLGSGNGLPTSYGCTGNQVTAKVYASSTKLWTDVNNQAVAGCAQTCGTALTYAPLPRTACYNNGTTTPQSYPVGCDGAGNCTQTVTAGITTCDAKCVDQNPNTPDCSAGQCVCHPTTYYADLDGDGYGDLNNASTTCTNLIAQGGWTTDARDCNDSVNGGGRYIRPETPNADGSMIGCCVNGSNNSPTLAANGTRSTSLSAPNGTPNPFTCMMCNGATSTPQPEPRGADAFGKFCQTANASLCRQAICSGVIGHNTTLVDGSLDSLCAVPSIATTCLTSYQNDYDGSCVVSTTVKTCTGSDSDPVCGGINGNFKTVTTRGVPNSYTDSNLVWSHAAEDFVTATCSLNCNKVNLGCNIDNSVGYKFASCINPGGSNSHCNDGAGGFIHTCSSGCGSGICKEDAANSYIGSCQSFTCGQTSVTYPHTVCDPNDPNQRCTYNTSYLSNGQCWLAAPLNIGTKINHTSDQNNTNGIQKWCYGDDQTNCNYPLMGALYQWAEAMNLPNSCNGSDCSASINVPQQGICPQSFHLPVDDGSSNLTTNEWYKLESAYGGTPCDPARTNWACATNGKSYSDLYHDGTSGFNAVYAGYCQTSLSCRDSHYPTPQTGDAAYLWSASQSDDSHALDRELLYNDNRVGRIANEAKSKGYTVRCVR